MAVRVRIDGVGIGGSYCQPHYNLSHRVISLPTKFEPCTLKKTVQMHGDEDRDIQTILVIDIDNLTL